MKIYLAIFEDRHMDDDIRVFDNLEAAKEQIEWWKTEYPHVTDWESEVHEPFDLDDGRGLLLLQADEEQEEGLVFSIQEKEVKSNYA